MSSRKKILSYCLLPIYLMAGVQGIGASFPPEQLQHQHEEFEAVHHEHTFHIGIFHFLGHLVEKVLLQEDPTDDYLQPAIILPVKKIEGEANKATFDTNPSLCLSEQIDVNINGPPIGHIYSFQLQTTFLTSCPLRGPPSIS